MDEVGSEIDGVAADEYFQRSGFETLPNELAARLESIKLDSEAYWKLLSALHYRLTRKTILARCIGRLDSLGAYFEALSGSAEVGSCAELWINLVEQSKNRLLFLFLPILPLHHHFPLLVPLQL